MPLEAREWIIDCHRSSCGAEKVGPLRRARSVVKAIQLYDLNFRQRGELVYGGGYIETHAHRNAVPTIEEMPRVSNLVR